MNTLLKTFFQKRIEHKYAGYFSGFLKTLKEPETKEIIKRRLHIFTVLLKERPY